jgi:hypothetical protein
MIDKCPKCGAVQVSGGHIVECKRSGEVKNVCKWWVDNKCQQGYYLGCIGKAISKEECRLFEIKGTGLADGLSKKVCEIICVDGCETYDCDTKKMILELNTATQGREDKK